MPHYYVTRSPDAWVEDMILGFPSYSMARQPDVGQLLLAPEVPDPRGWPVVGAYSAPFSDPAYYYIGDDSQVRLSERIKRAIGNLLGLTLVEEKLANILGELFTLHARIDGTRWKPLRPNLRGFYEIWLGHKVWAMPGVAGGATLTESFNQADSSTVGPDQTWTEITANWQTTTNELDIAATHTGIGLLRVGADLATDDHYAQIICTSLNSPTGAANILGANVRFSATAQTYYVYRVRRTSAGAEQQQLYKVVNGSHTSLAGTDTGDLGLTEPWTPRTEADGSSITGKRDGATQLGPVTDTAIVDNLRTGVYGAFGSGTTPTGNNWEAGDLAAAALPAVGSWMSQGYGR